MEQILLQTRYVLEECAPALLKNEILEIAEFHVSLYEADIS